MVYVVHRFRRRKKRTAPTTKFTAKQPAEKKKAKTASDSDSDWA
jgi:hypothetical protein